ncbi:hypothetical protein B0H21DRAFT_851329 [Amylocystis lapponica]|nr:hypothetical protein B0H21DRAFT_851329 [Amylocystis lapponica]
MEVQWTDLKIEARQPSVLYGRGFLARRSRRVQLVQTVLTDDVGHALALDREAGGVVGSRGEILVVPSETYVGTDPCSALVLVDEDTATEASSQRGNMSRNTDHAWSSTSGSQTTTRPVERCADYPDCVLHEHAIAPGSWCSRCELKSIDKRAYGLEGRPACGKSKGKAKKAKQFNPIQKGSRSSRKRCTNVEKAFKALGTVAETILREAQEHITMERKSLQETKTMGDATTNAEILRLQQQNTLRRPHEGLLGDFTAEGDRRLREAFSEMSQSNAAAQEEMDQLGKAQSDWLETVRSRGREWSIDLEQRLGGVEGKRTRDSDRGSEAVSSARATISDGLADVQNSVMSSTTAFSSDLQRQPETQKFGAMFNEAFDHVSRFKRARIEVTDAMATEVQSGYRSIQRGVASTSRNVEAASNRVLSESGGLATSTETFRGAAAAHLSNLRQTTQTLVEQGTREDMPTGSTRRKHSWNYVDEWQLTQTREVLLKDWRQ